MSADAFFYIADNGLHLFWRVFKSQLLASEEWLGRPVLGPGPGWRPEPKSGSTGMCEGISVFLSSNDVRIKFAASVNAVLGPAETVKERYQ
jgi:hypothetical protein